jgi:hypothetical protein
MKFVNFGIFVFNIFCHGRAKNYASEKDYTTYMSYIGKSLAATASIIVAVCIGVILLFVNIHPNDSLFRLFAIMIVFSFIILLIIARDKSVAAELILTNRIIYAKYIRENKWNPFTKITYYEYIFDKKYKTFLLYENIYSRQGVPPERDLITLLVRDFWPSQVRHIQDATIQKMLKSAKKIW